MLVRTLDALADTKPVITLHWFSYHRRNHSVYLMLNSLVCQLLDSSPELDIPAHFDEGVALTIDGMAHFFISCLEVRLRSVSVFILLDSLSYYESGERVRDLCWLLEQVAEIVNGPPHSSGHTLKVLVTSPTRFSRVGARMQSRGGTLVEVPATIDSKGLDLDDRRIIASVWERLSSSYGACDN